ncbi:MAG: hypothetical protein A2044_04165 [Candidatus Firestonebacteria bacterium GWA2_43_8]|nr:MAG: hypothetical protein A2044_04165 [Candidatus Firestonebacteria bacterium GWA2_43_8]
MNVVGINIRRLREGKRITLREFARSLNLSASFISQVEMGKASPSLSTLKDIADKLSTTVGELIGEGHAASGEVPVTREQDRRHVKDLEKGVGMYLLTSPDNNKMMEPLLFKMNKNATSGGANYTHFGQEFVLVLKGSIEIKLNDSNYILKKGDSIYFNSKTPHSFRNIGNGEAEAVWVITPPSF